MKSRKLLPVESRYSDGRYFVGKGLFAYHAQLADLKKYHKALVAAEYEGKVKMKKLGLTETTLKSHKLFPVEKRVKGGKFEARGGHRETKNYERVIKIIGKYHKALEAAEVEIEKLKRK